MPNESNDEGQSTPTDINALIVKLPTFWSNNPSIWFIQAEAQFALGKLTKDLSKYNYVVGTLPESIADSISDVLENPPATGLYANLKDTLIKRHSLSIEARIRKLVSDEEMGDKKPSEYYRTLKKLSGNTTAVGEGLLKKLWMNRLPQAVGVALIPQKEDDIGKLMKLADQVWEAIKTANVSAVSSKPTTNDDDLRSEISALKVMIEKLSFDRSRSRSRSFQRRDNRPQSNNNRSRSRGPRFNPKGKFCYNHFRYGNKARKCEQPCEFNAQSQSSSSTNQNSNPN